MKINQITSVLAAAAVSLPLLASAQVEEGLSPGDIDSTITFNLRVTMEDQDRPTRFDTMRFGPRELIELIVENTFLLGVETGEGVFEAVGRGARIMLIDGDVWIVERDGSPVLNISDNLEFSMLSQQISAGTSRQGSSNTQTMYLAGLDILSDDVYGSSLESSESFSQLFSADLQGVSTERSSFRSTPRRSSFSRDSRTDVQGSGRYFGQQTTVEGSVRVQGRETFEND